MIETNWTGTLADYERQGSPPGFFGLMQWRLSQPPLRPSEDAVFVEDGEVFVDQEQVEQLTSEFERRLAALFIVHRVVSGGGWRELALKLMTEYVPALQIEAPTRRVKKGVGRPAKRATERAWVRAIRKELRLSTDERPARARLLPQLKPCAPELARRVGRLRPISLLSKRSKIFGRGTSRIPAAERVGRGECKSRCRGNT